MHGIVVLGSSVKRVAVFALLAGAFLLGSAPHARAAPCGLPDAQPWWIDFASGSVSFRYWIWGRPGLIAATEGGPTVPKKLRGYGVQTIFWQMRLGDIAGTTSKPKEPATIPAAAQRLYEKAVDASGGCATPLVALNELNGPGTTTPWTASNAQYRENVLELIRQLAARGARPFLLLPSAPYTKGAAAADWWRQVAQYGDIVPEVYFSGPSMWRQGPIVASRLMRRSLRQAVRNLSALAIPTSRIGLMLGFQNSPGGRSGLQPASAWYQVVKWEALAAKQVARDTGIATVWSWGWATFSADKSGDEEKRNAACVYLWTRAADLCDGPAAAGQGFDTSLTVGQIDALPAGVQCLYGDLTIPTASLDALTLMLGDRDVAFSALLQRLVEEQQTAMTPEDVAAAERMTIALAYRSSGAAYNAALAQLKSSRATARALIADDVRRVRIQATLAAVPPTENAVRTFYTSYPTRLVRRVQVDGLPWWLGGRKTGYALQGVAPDRIFSLATGVPTTIWTSHGPVTLTPLGETDALGALPLTLARTPIQTGLRWFSQGDAFDTWTATRQSAALTTTVCARDDLPEVGAVDLASFVPFLGLNL